MPSRAQTVTETAPALLDRAYTAPAYGANRLILLDIGQTDIRPIYGRYTALSRLRRSCMLPVYRWADTTVDGNHAVTCAKFAGLRTETDARRGRTMTENDPISVEDDGNPEETRNETRTPRGIRFSDSEWERVKLGRRTGSSAGNVERPSVFSGFRRGTGPVGVGFPAFPRRFHSLSRTPVHATDTGTSCWFRVTWDPCRVTRRGHDEIPNHINWINVTRNGDGFPSRASANKALQWRRSGTRRTLGAPSPSGESGVMIEAPTGVLQAFAPYTPRRAREAVAARVWSHRGA